MYICVHAYMYVCIGVPTFPCGLLTLPNVSPCMKSASADVLHPVLVMHVLPPGCQRGTHHVEVLHAWEAFLSKVTTSKVM